MPNKSEIVEKLKELQAWFIENPKLPEEINLNLLHRFLKCMYYDVEKTKKLIEVNFNQRNRNPHIFINRDPDDVSIATVKQVSDIVPMPGLTPDRCKLLCYRLLDFDPLKLNSVSESKLFFMLSDSRFTIDDLDEEATSDSPDMDTVTDDDKIADGDIQVVDISGFTIRHIYKMSILTMRIHMKFLQEAYPVRLRAMHIINCPSYLDKLIAVIRPFVRDDVYKLIHFHTNGIESLYECVPREMLPEEFGGSAGKLSDIKAKWNTLLAEKRNYLMDDKHWKVEEILNGNRWTWF